MKRKILFRGKRKKDGEWVEGNLFIPNNPDTPTQICMGTHTIRICYEIIPETVGEFTGLRDKNKKGIYEDDIVKIDFCGDYDYYKVSFDEKNARFVIGTLDFTFWQDVQERSEVVGNVFDNPELLKGDAKE